VSKEKHEVLFSRFQINYNQLDERFRKGSILVREEVYFYITFASDSTDRLSQVTEPVPEAPFTITLPQPDKIISIADPSPTGSRRTKTKRNAKLKTKLTLLHCDVIKDEFWDARPGLLTE
jgi:tRNA(His) guanylyltransferase